jgi:transcriptional regulator GlxA family with amidase domain
LREAASDTTTVATIATQFGFWHLGRFAINYQALFGEPPHATLRRQRECLGIDLPKLYSQNGAYQ